MASQEPLEQDPRSILQDVQTGAVLLSNEIKRYAIKHQMIDPFDDTCLEPASYNMRLGKQYRIAGKTGLLDDKNRYLTIRPYEVVVLSTFEKLRLPRFLIGRWSLRVSDAYEGLLWTGGAQVDPGYEGSLYCPIYNLSSEEIQLTYKDKIFSIDFVRTTPFIKKDKDGYECIPWEKKKRKDIIEDFDKKGLKSELVKTAKRAEEASHRIDTFQAITFTVLGIIIVALTVIVMAPFGETLICPTIWQWITLIISLIAIIIAIVAICKAKH